MVERESMEYDLVIVGAGPSGLSAAIRAKQVAAERGEEISVCVIEKGSEVGAHIMSGAVMEPRAMQELFPDWEERGAPLLTPVGEEKFMILTEKGSLNVPVWSLPPQLQNHGNYIISLGNVCRWLAEQAEAMEVEIYPGMAASELVIEDNVIKGVVAGVMGKGKAGDNEDYEVGMELRGKYVMIGEGVRGSLAKQLMAQYDLRADCDPQTFGIGFKELWELDPAKHKEGFVMHTGGWPMDMETWGGSFIYHLDNNQAYVGYVVGLDYKNPHLSPFEEFQRFKQHPSVRPMLEGGRRVSYGARAINEGGLQSIPKLTFPGGMLLGCSAGFLNVPKIKGSHTAMKSGMLAAETACDAIFGGSEGGDDLVAYEANMKKSWVYEELHAGRNFVPYFERFGMAGFALGGAELHLGKWGLNMPWTLGHKHAPHESLKPADKMPKIEYPKPDNEVSFSRLDSVALSFTNHEEDQPVHLTLKDASVPIEHNLALYDAPEQRYCPAGVYEIIREEDGSNPRLQINAQNCVHCKTCDIKDPTQNITWVTPEGGGGPNYPNM